MKDSISKNDRYIAAIINILILAPVYFQIKGGLFRDPALIYNHGGVIDKLPLPLSLIGCFAGILLIGRHKNARPALVFVLSSLLLMCFSLFITSNGQLGSAREKIILLLQFLLPMFAMVLGQLYQKIDNKMLVLSKTFFFVLFFVVSLQMFCSWFQGYTFAAYLYLFSIYQHFQYVPFVFTAAYLLVLYGLGKHSSFKKWVWLFLPIMIIYAVISTSVSALLLLLLGTILYVFRYYGLKNIANIKIIGIVIATVLLLLAYLHNYHGTQMLTEKLKISETNEITGGIAMPGIQKRLSYWKYYSEAAVKDMRTFLIGNPNPPEKNQYPSAHNYYLDYLYSFGILSLVPLLYIVVETLYRIYRRRSDIYNSPELFGLTIVVLFLIFIDNMLKVGLRQPYPGIFSFFIWGILISKLSENQFVK